MMARRAFRSQRLAPANVFCDLPRLFCSCCHRTVHRSPRPSRPRRPGLFLLGRVIGVALTAVLTREEYNFLLSYSTNADSEGLREGWGVHEQREWREGTEYEYRHLCEKAQGDLLGWWICLLLWLVMVSWVYTYIGLSDRVPKQGQFIAYGSYFHKAITKSIGTSKFLAAFNKCLFFSIKLT